MAINLKEVSKELFKGRVRSPVMYVLNRLPPEALKTIQGAVNRGEMGVALEAFRAVNTQAIKSTIDKVEDVIKESSQRGLAGLFKPRMESAVLRAFERMKGERTIAELTELFSQRGSSVLNELMENYEDIFTSEITEDIDSLLLASGRKSVFALPVQGIIQNGFVYDLFNRDSAVFAQNYKLDLIRGISDTTKESVRNAVQRSIVTGKNPVETARAFRSTIGLTPFQEQAVRNYEGYLRNLKSQALNRSLRDHRFDPTIMRAISDKKPLTEDQIQRMTARYRERYVKHRAEVISRTESLRAASIGQEQGIKQMAEGGFLDTERIRGFWSYAKDSKTRDAHRAVPGMNPDGIRIGELFRTPLGAMEFPRDPRGTAANTVLCRCAKFYRYTGDESSVIPKTVVKPVPKPKPKPVKKPKPKPKPVKKPKPTSEELYQTFLDKQKNAGPYEVHKARVEYAKSLETKNELQSAKDDILEDMIVRGGGSKKDAAAFLSSRSDTTMATEWMPFDVLSDLNSQGVEINVHKKKIRASYDPNTRVLNVGKRESGDVLAHELSHSVDDMFGGFEGVGRSWKNSDYDKATNGQNYSSIFKKHRTDNRRTYPNGDGDYFLGNWMNNYEGRIYKGYGGTNGIEHWAMNVQRYSKYRAELSKGITSTKALERSEWGKARSIYPELSTYIEKLFSKDFIN